MPCADVLRRQAFAGAATFLAERNARQSRVKHSNFRGATILRTGLALDANREIGGPGMSHQVERPVREIFFGESRQYATVLQLICDT
jgi:hypothetical protein